MLSGSSKNCRYGGVADCQRLKLLPEKQYQNSEEKNREEGP